MSSPKEPLSAKLIVGILTGNPDARGSALAVLCEHFGPMDLAIEPAPFGYTTYYNREMGDAIQRQVVSFPRSGSPGIARGH